MTNISIVVLGGSGLVGSCLMEQWANKYELIAPSRQQLDVLDGDSVKAFLQETPAEIVVNLAAWADVDGAEVEKGNVHGRVHGLNTQHPRRLAQVCGELHKYLVHVSTDYVFDGTNADRPYREDDQPNPLGWYAKTKLLGEQAVLESGADVCVARVEMPFTGRGHKKLDFARLCATRLRAGQPILGVTDQRVTPVFLDDCVAALQRLVEARYTGCIHLASRDWTTPYAFARSIARRLGLPLEQISTETFERFSTTRPARRPQHPWLDVAMFSGLFGADVLRPVEEELDTWVNQLLAAASQVS